MDIAGLVAGWKLKDARLNAESFGGYAPTRSVFASRIASLYEITLRTMALAIRADAWMESAPEYPGRTFQVGFVDNRDANAYRIACEELARQMNAIDFKAWIDQGALFVTLPAKIEAETDEAARLYYGG